MSSMQSIQTTRKEGTGTISLQHLNAHRLLNIWRKKNAKRLKGLDAVKAIRELRQGLSR